MKKRKNLMTLLMSMSFLLIFTLAAHSQQKPVAGQTPQKPAQLQPIAKVPTIDPNMLRRLQGSVDRSTLINTLMGNQATRTILENLAKSTKIKTSELSIKTLDGNPIPPAPQGQQIDQLNWNAGIKFSMIKNRPTFFHPPTNSTFPLGRISVYGVQLFSESISSHIDNDVFPFATCTLDLNLPLPPATYMIVVQTNSILFPEITISDRNPNRKLQNLVPLTSRDGWVALTQISPHVYRQGDNFGICTISVKLGLPIEPNVLFGGFTITRL
jgi:hypothetical protein